MQLFTEKRPHIRSKDTSNIIMSDVLIAMSFLVILSFLYFGKKSIILILSSVCTCYILDTILKSFKNRNFQLSDVSSIVTGVVIALIMPATIPIYVPITASIIAITIAKYCFGGLGQNIFNPAATGISFVALCWPKLMFIYPIPSTTNLTEIFSENVAYTLKLGGRPAVEIFDMILGKQPGPIGTTHILVICSCIMWLVMRKAVYFPSILSFVCVCAVISFIFPRIYSERLLSVVYELSSGSLLFGCVFMMTDPVTSPKFKPAKVVYGGMVGLLAMIFRYFGSFDQGIYFAILLGNASSFSIDRLVYKNQDFVNNFPIFFKKFVKNDNRPVILYEEVKQIKKQEVK